MRETNSLDERQLMRDYERGEPAAIRAVDEWIDAALRAGFFSLREEWDDVRQEVRTRVLENLRNERFDGRSTLRTYVHRITRNVCVDMSRRAYRHRERSLDPAKPPRAMRAAPGGPSAMIARDLVGKILGALTEGDRILVDLVFGEQCSYAEVAQRLGITEEAVKTRVFRCKNRMLKRYERLTRRGR
jgi:RNA polymerase sigma factor (sigma-70 family)